MRASLIVEAQIAANRSACITDAFIGPQIYLLVFDRAPQALDEHIVSPSAFTIHADGDALLSEEASEGQPGELRALIGIDDLGFAVMSQGVFECLDAESRAIGM